MPCSAVSLSIATILSVTGVACLAIAFSTDNWSEIRVNRNLTRERLLSESNSDPAELPTEFDTDFRYFSRDEGLFRVCFVNKKPKDCKCHLFKLIGFGRFEFGFTSIKVNRRLQTIQITPCPNGSVVPLKGR